MYNAWKLRTVESKKEMCKNRQKVIHKSVMTIFSVSDHKAGQDWGVKWGDDCVTGWLVVSWCRSTRREESSPREWKGPEIRLCRSPLNKKEDIRRSQLFSNKQNPKKIQPVFLLINAWKGIDLFIIISAVHFTPRRQSGERSSGRPLTALLGSVSPLSGATKPPHTIFFDVVDPGKNA